MNSISDIQHIFYINLASRADRKLHVEEQLKSVGLYDRAQRFNAVKMLNGAIGCTISHIKLLETAKANNLDHILIIEDDILFTNPPLFVQQLNSFLSKERHFDVLLIAGNNMPPYTKIDDTCVRVKTCQTTTGYLVKHHYYDTLIENFREGVKKLMQEPHNHKYYALDKYWFRLQALHHWYLIIPLTVSQKSGYSDIEQRNTNYTNAMLDLDKTEILRRQREYSLFNTFFR